MHYMTKIPIFYITWMPTSEIRPLPILVDHKKCIFRIGIRIYSSVFFFRLFKIADSGKGNFCFHWFEVTVFFWHALNQHIFQIAGWPLWPHTAKLLLLKKPPGPLLSFHSTAATRHLHRQKVMSMPSAMTRRSEVKIDPTGSNTRKRKRQESQKRELPTRHSLLTDVAVADLEDAHTSKWLLVLLGRGCASGRELWGACRREMAFTNPSTCITTESNQLQFNGHTIIRILPDASQVDGCQTLADGQGMAQASELSRSELQTEIKVPAFRVIDHKIPAASKKTAQKLPVSYAAPFR
jgi:hypothetical protein